MKIKQITVAIGGILAVIMLYWFGNTIPPKKPKAPMMAQNSAAENKIVLFPDLLQKAKQKLSISQLNRVAALEKALPTGNSNQQSGKPYQQLAQFWHDSARIFEPYAYYNAQAAKLENSEKTLTFAAHQFLDNLMVEGDPAMQNWLASNAKDLLERALLLNPTNDSSIIGLGACYILGGISNNPMQGILPVKAITEKNPNNLYAQLILGLGGKKSGQYDKAIERFSVIVHQQPANLEATLHLAECYDLKGDKENAIKWYTKVAENVGNTAAKKELNNRINALKQ